MTEEITQENTALDKVLQESGLVLNDAEQIKQSYLPFFDQLAAIKEEAKKINFETPTALDEKIARELRLRTVKVRTGSEEVKENRKKIHMLKANVEQSSYNLIKSTCQLDEEKFAQVEKARERAEAARKAALKIERESELKQYDAEVEFVDLANMPEDSYVKFLESAKIANEQRIEAERKAEEDRVAKEKAEVEERDRITAENERLRKESEKREKQIAEENKKREIKQKAGLARQEMLSEIGVMLDFNSCADMEEATWIKFYDTKNKEYQAEQNRLLLEKKKAEAKAKKEKDEQDAKLKKEKEAREKAEAELKAKKEEEEKAKQDAAALAEAELSKGDNEKFASLMQDLEMLKYKYTFKSAKYKKLSLSVNELLEKIIVYSKPKI